MSKVDTFALATLNALTANIALVDDQGIIVAVNDSWRSFATENAAKSNVSENANYLKVCENVRGADTFYAQQIRDALKSILRGDLNEFAVEYPCHSPHEQRWFTARVTRLTVDDNNYAVVAHENISQRKLAEQLIQQKAKETTLLEERNRISRELHDGVNQTLFSSLTIAQAAMRNYETKPMRTKELLEDLVQLNRTAMAEMRILLHELRPDSIINTSLASLFQQLMNTIINRLDGVVSLSINGNEFQIPSDVHVGMYRIVQEAMNNVLKHSEATVVSIVLTYEDNCVEISVIDNGHGFNMCDVQKQIGLNSMQERADAIEAHLDIVSILGQGTQVNIKWAL